MSPYTSSVETWWIALDAVPSGRLQQHVGAIDVGLDKGVGLHQRAVDVGLGGKVDDGVDLVGLHGGIHGRSVGNVALDKGVALWQNAPRHP